MGRRVGCLWVWGNVDRRSGFGRRCVDQTEKLTHRGFWLDRFEGMWIGGQVLVGGVWIGGVWIGSVWIELRNSLTLGRIGTEKWKGNSSWVCVWRSSDCGWSCEECVWSALLWGVRVRACATVRSVLLWESLNRVVWGVEMVWSENMNGNDFTGVLGYFTVKGEKHFSWLNLLVQPNTQVLWKNISGSNLKPKQTQPNTYVKFCVNRILFTIWSLSLYFMHNFKL